MTTHRSPASHHRRLAPLCCLAAALLLLVAGCAQQEAAKPPEEPAPVKVVNSQLGIEIAAVPAGLEVVPTSDATIVLAPADKKLEGRLVIEAGPVEKGGINLVEAVKQHQAAAAAREGGVYKGQNELKGVALGTTFVSRAQWQEGGRTLEEIEVFMLHPARDRKLLIHYRYPAGADTAQRMNDHVFALVGELGPVSAAPAGG